MGGKEGEEGKREGEKEKGREGARRVREERRGRELGRGAHIENTQKQNVFVYTDNTPASYGLMISQSPEPTLVQMATSSHRLCPLCWKK